MKKTIVILGALLIGSCAMAEDVLLIKNITLNNFWDKKGLSEEKVLNVGNKILVDNKIPRRIPIFVINDSKVLNATSNAYDKKVSIYTPMFLYIDNDDELAFILSHEIAHSVEAYGGMMKYISMTSNAKKYELKADLNGIDYMVKSGYDPIAAITIMNKIAGEPVWDWGFMSTHVQVYLRKISAILKFTIYQDKFL